VSPDYPTIRDWMVTSGEFFTDADVRALRKVAVVGHTIVESLFDGGDPVGSQIQIRNVPFTVVGVLAEKGQNAGGQDQDDVVLVPYTTAQSRLSGNVRIGQIVASTFSENDIAAAQDEIALIMREAHKLDGAPDDFTVRNQTEIAAAATSTTRVMSALLAAIASISLLVGGIGIMNIMLVSVTERTREIGIRMAIGAKGKDILTQFLVEALTLSIAGGLIGILLGVGASRILAWKANWNIALPPESILLAFGFSAAIGVFFGFYPARKASRLDPIEALRYE
jgi:putative ABC transport system permease protein